ncbi:hypothetical protein LZ31DRAFT_604862, partial [Colletotrichum somersetense]
MCCGCGYRRCSFGQWETRRGWGGRVFAVCGSRAAAGGGRGRGNFRRWRDSFVTRFRDSAFAAVVDVHAIWGGGAEGG